MAGRLLAIDWGSSALRGALLDDDGQVIEQRASARGMLTIQPGGFAEVFEGEFGDWMDMPGTRCLMAGMVGSKQGWVEAAYCPCPAGLQDVAGRLTRLQASAHPAVGSKPPRDIASSRASREVSSSSQRSSTCPIRVAFADSSPG